MGASAWHYTVPYQPDIQAALDTLRQDAFAAWKHAHPRKRYRSIDAVLTAVGADGTSSILDVHHISTTPLPATKQDISQYHFHDPQDMARFMAALYERLGNVFPLSREDYLALFGTDRPTRHVLAHASASLTTLYDRVERNSGVYLLLYENDVPTKIYFMGISGD